MLERTFWRCAPTGGDSSCQAARGGDAGFFFLKREKTLDFSAIKLAIFTSRVVRGRDSQALPLKTNRLQQRSKATRWC